MDIEKYKAKHAEWLNTVDSESVKAVFNILPDVFLNRIESGQFDKSLIMSVPGGEYEVPLYYVTKAWDVLLKGSLDKEAFRIGPEEDEEEDYEAALKEFMEDIRGTRTRAQAIQQNDEVKVIWKDKLGIDIDNLDVDFYKYNKHIPPKVELREFNYYFFNVLDGVCEWILNAVNCPDYTIYHDSVSCLMEFTAYIKLLLLIGEEPFYNYYH